MIMKKKEIFLRNQIAEMKKGSREAAQEKTKNEKPDSIYPESIYLKEVFNV